MSDEDAHAVVASQAAAKKWACHTSQAHSIPAGGASGGCAVAVRAGVGISPHPDKLVKGGYRHCLRIAHVSAIIRGGFRLGFIYPKDLEGLSEGNLLLLQESACALLPCGTMESGRGLEYHFSGASGLQVVRFGWTMHICTTSSTCHKSVYDDFVVSKALAPSVYSVIRLVDAACWTHWPPRIIVRGDARRQEVK